MNGRERSTYGKCQLGIFAKYWQPGQVKTRLAVGIGADAAARLHRLFLEVLLGRLERIGHSRVLAYSPAERKAEFERIAGPNWSVQPQHTGDLGARIQCYFEAALVNGCRRVVLLGSDSPTVPMEYVDRAFELLKEYSLVLGPSADGGYYLVGIRDTVPPIFGQITWGTDQVWPQTMARLEALGCSFGKLPAWYDVDTLTDLRRLEGDLQNQGRHLPEYTELRTAIAEVLRSLPTDWRDSM
jgi:rSAM/selenodomain-associated transferase 1